MRFKDTVHKVPTGGIHTSTMIYYSYLNMKKDFTKEGGGKKRVNTCLAHLLSL